MEVGRAFLVVKNQFDESQGPALEGLGKEQQVIGRIEVGRCGIPLQLPHRTGNSEQALDLKVVLHGRLPPSRSNKCDTMTRRRSNREQASANAIITRRVGSDMPLRT
jgi:hypothetical protein